MGFCCRQFPCESCQTCYFDILDGASREKLNNMIKKSSGCCKSYFGNVDDFQIGFPVTATAEDKALILSAAVFLDYNYFEDPPDRDNDKL